MSVTSPSPWTCVDHSVSRLPPATKRPIQARFHCGSRTSLYLTSPTTATRRFIMQKARRHTHMACSDLPSSGCFSPFPHGTRSLSVSREYLALPDGPGRFAQDYSCPALLRIPLGLISIHVRNCHPLRLNFPDHSILDLSTTTRLFPGRSPLLGESLLFSLPGGTKMFQFPPFASIHTYR